MVKVALLIERGGPKTGCFGGPPRQFLVETDQQGRTFTLPSADADDGSKGAVAVRAMLESDYDVQVVVGEVKARGAELVVYEAEATDALELPDRLPHAERGSGRVLVWRTPAELEGRLLPAELARQLEGGWTGVLEL